MERLVLTDEFLRATRSFAADLVFLCNRLPG